MSEAADPLAEMVTAIIARQLVVAPETIAPEARLEALGMDSIDMVEVLFAIEESFDISVPFSPSAPQDDGPELTTVASVVEAVRALVAARGEG